MSLFASHAPVSVFLVHYVLEPAIRSLALAGAVWLLLRLFRARDVSLRLAVWTAVLYAALAMPLVGRLLPGLPVLLPINRAAPAARIVSPAATSTVSTDAQVRRTVVPPAERHAGVATAFREANPPSPAALAPAEPLPAATAAAGGAVASRSGGALRIPWLALAAMLYGLVAAVFLARFAIGFFLSLRLRRTSAPIDDDRLNALLAREARTAGVRTAPRLAQSPALAVPVTLGVSRPVILFPETWREWSEGQTSAVLAHELSHVARGDARTQILSGIHRAIFWFSPLSWWLDRALTDLAEQASDDEALRAGTDRARYAEVLLHFFRALGTARRRIRWQAVSMAQGTRSARRVERILSGSRLSRRLGQAALAAVVFAVVPLFCLAAAVRPALTAQAPSAAPPAAPAPPAPPAFAATAPDGSSVRAGLPRAVEVAERQAGAGIGLPETRTARPPAPVRVAALPPESLPPEITWSYAAEVQTSAPGSGSETQAASQSVRMESCGGQGPIALDWRGRSGNAVVTECTSSADLRHFATLRGQMRGSFLWFRKDGRDYIVRDPATVKAAFDALNNVQRETLAPAFPPAGFFQPEQFEAQMHALQASLQDLSASAAAQMSRAQEQLAAGLQASNASSQQELARAQQQFYSAMQAFNASAVQQEQALRQAQEEMQREMKAMQGQLAAQMAAAQKQAEQAQEQSSAALARYQAARLATARAKGEAAQALQQLHQILDRAIARGLAKPERTGR